MTSQPQDDPDSLLVRLVRYLHDCLAAQNQWASDVNVLRQKDVFLVPLAYVSIWSQRSKRAIWRSCVTARGPVRVSMLIR